MRKPDPQFKRVERRTLELIATDLQNETTRLRQAGLDRERQTRELWVRLEAMQKYANMLVELHDRGELDRLLDGELGRAIRALMAKPLQP